MQILSLCFIAALAPITRLIPKLNTIPAGHLSWLAPLAALPVILLYMWYLSAFLACRREGEGMGELIMRGAGRFAGRILLTVIAVYFLLYSGFILLSGADRYVSTIYHAGKPFPFIAVMLILGLIGALGKARALLRLTKMILPLILSVLALVLVFSLADADLESLLPATVYDAVPVIKGTVPVLDIVFTVPVIAGFLLFTDNRGVDAKGLIGWSLGVCLVISAISAAIVGSFGEELTTQLTHPFFVMVRNVKLFGTIERIEAVIVSLWLFSDFALLTMLIISASRCLRLAFGCVIDDPERLFDMKKGRWLISACGLAILVAALLFGDSEPELEYISERIVPVLNLALGLVVLPLVFAVGKIRKTL